VFWLSDEAWSAIEPLLPSNQPGARRVDDRRIISGIIHVLQSGCRWRDCPSEYGPYTTVYNCFKRWSRRKVWQQIYASLVEAGRIGGTVALDSTHVKAHRSAAGAQKNGKRSGHCPIPRWPHHEAPPDPRLLRRQQRREAAPHRLTQHGPDRHSAQMGSGRSALAVWRDGWHIAKSARRLVYERAPRSLARRLAAFRGFVDTAIA
jgi:transposase